MSLDDGFGQVSGFQLIAATILDVNDFDIGVFSFHLIDETITAVNTGAAGLVMDDDGNLPFTTNEFGHFVSGQRRSGQVVSSGRSDGNVAVYTRVKTDDRNALLLERVPAWG